MKNFILIILTLIMTTTIVIGGDNDNIYPLDIKVVCYPKDIYYGDVCFAKFQVTNLGKETLYLPYGRNFLDEITGKLLYGDYSRAFYNKREEELQVFESFDTLEGFPHRSTAPISFPGHPVKSGETMEFHTRMIWVPLPEFSYYNQATQLLQLVNKNQYNTFYVRFYVPYRDIYRRHSLRVKL